MIAYINFLDIYIVIRGDQNIIEEITFSKDATEDDFTPNSEVAKAKKQLCEYLNKERKEFDLNLQLNDKTFFDTTYHYMKQIPYGETKSYKQLGQMFDSGQKSRAIGNACNKNKFIIVIPCHRVVKSDGGLGGFAPGIKYKEFLLDLEQQGGYNG